MSQDLPLGDTYLRTWYSLNNNDRVLVVARQIYKIQIVSTIFFFFTLFQDWELIYPNIWLTEPYWVYSIVNSHSSKCYIGFTKWSTKLFALINGSNWNDYICHFLIEQNVLNIHYVSGTIPGFRFTAVNEIID